MSLISLARETAEKRNSEIAEKNRIFEHHQIDLQSRLVKLRDLISAEVLQMDREVCKYGRLVVTGVHETSFSTIGKVFMCITIPSSDENLVVLELSMGIDVGEHKYSDESDPDSYEDPIIWANVYHPERQGFSRLVCIDNKIH